MKSNSRQHGQMKSRDGKSQRREEKRRRKKIKKRKSPKKDPGARKGRRVAKHCAFPRFVSPEGRKVGSLKRRVRAGQMRDEKLHAVVARGTFQSQKCQKLTGSEHNWKLRCRKSARRHGVKHISKSKCQKLTGAAQRTFQSQKCQKLTGSEHNWKLRCRKSACRCGAKQIAKSKVQKAEGVRALCRFAWQAQGIVHLVAHLVKSEQNMRVL